LSLLPPLLLPFFSLSPLCCCPLTSGADVESALLLGSRARDLGARSRERSGREAEAEKEEEEEERTPSW
jgi:hypothetical protein